MQAGGGFTETQWGLDEGSFTWETDARTLRSAYPKVGDSSIVLPSAGGSYFATLGLPRMYVIEVTDTLDDSTGIVKIVAKISGSINPGAVKKERILPGVDSGVFNLPTLPSTTKINVIARVPKLRVTREYVTSVQPTYSGVSEAYSAAFLPALPTFSISFTPDPDEPQTINYNTGWHLDVREWEPVANAVWRVRETFNYYWNIAV